MRRIEFTGLPGSGKTTLLPQVRLYLQGNYWAILLDRDLAAEAAAQYNFVLRMLAGLLSANLFQRLLPNLSYYPKLWEHHQQSFVDQNAEFWQIFQQLNNNSPTPDNHKQLIRRWMLSTGALIDMARHQSARNAWLMLDEGIFQKVVNLFTSIESSQVDKNGIQAYLNAAPLPDILISMETSAEVSFKRCSQRGFPARLAGQPEASIRNYFENVRTVLDFAMNYYRSKGGNIIRIADSEFGGPGTTGEPQWQKAMEAIL